MDEADLRLDGNAAAGVLSEVFAVEATSAVVTCANCGATGAMGEAHVYANAPGTVIRCPACTAVLVRLVRTRERLVADLRGIGLMSF